MHIHADLTVVCTLLRKLQFIYIYGVYVGKENAPCVATTSCKPPIVDVDHLMH